MTEVTTGLYWYISLHELGVGTNFYHKIQVLDMKKKTVEYYDSYQKSGRLYLQLAV